MSKKFGRAVAEGRVVVRNVTSGEAMIKVPLPDGTERTVLVPPLSEVELAPKFTEARLLARSRNLSKLLYKGYLRIK
jgi:hypothetical protein